MLQLLSEKKEMRFIWTHQKTINKIYHTMTAFHQNVIYAKALFFQKSRMLYVPWCILTKGTTEVIPSRATFHTLNTKLYNRVIHKRVLRHSGTHGQVRQSLAIWWYRVAIPAPCRIRLMVADACYGEYWIFVCPNARHMVAAYGSFLRSITAFASPSRAMWW